MDRRELLKGLAITSFSPRAADALEGVRRQTQPRLRQSVPTRRRRILRARDLSKIPGRARKSCLPLQTLTCGTTASVSPIITMRVPTRWLRSNGLAVSPATGSR